MIDLYNSIVRPNLEYCRCVVTYLHERYKIAREFRDRQQNLQLNQKCMEYKPTVQRING